MKKLLIFAGLCVILFTACNSGSVAPSSAVFILVDNTEKCEDSKENLISTQSLCNYLGTNGSVTFQKVNSVALNSNVTLQISIPDDATSLTKKDILDPFITRLDTLRENFLGPTSGTEGSSIYKPFCHAFTELSHSSATNKTLVVVSDMIENSSIGNFYKDKPFAEVKARLDSSGVKIPHNTSNIKVIILYNPNGDAKKERQFERAMGFWQPILTEAGISYIVKANL